MAVVVVVVMPICTCSPENMLATAAIIKLKITPGPAIFLATMPATKYMPVPQQEPTPSDVKSSVVKHFCNEAHAAGGGFGIIIIMNKLCFGRCKVLCIRIMLPLVLVFCCVGPRPEASAAPLCGLIWRRASTRYHRPALARRTSWWLVAGWNGWE